MGVVARIVVIAAGVVGGLVAGFALILLAIFGLFSWRSHVVGGAAARAQEHWGEVRRGMTDDEVERRLGSPNERDGEGCWRWGRGWVFDASTVYTVCFTRGRVDTKYATYGSD